MRMPMAFSGFIPDHGEVMGGSYESTSGMFMLHAWVTDVNPVVFTGPGVKSLFTVGSKKPVF
jgi:hypothetical protein